MPADLKALVDTIVVVMLENRSFDHMLGYLSLTSGADRPELDGITSPRKKLFVNVSQGQAFRPFPTPDKELPSDLPHSRALIKEQLGRSPTTGQYTMRGFVEAYRLSGAAANVKKPEPMGFLMADSVPMLDFFAANYAVCNRWFAPLPTDTFPNRLMALSGYTSIEKTSPQLLDQPVVYEWLTHHEVRWRVYRSGLPFGVALPRLWDDILDDQRFRSVRFLARDVVNEPGATFPQVIFVEPAYLDVPVHLGFQPNDDHPPLPVAPGQEFLRQVYQALTANPARWAKTVLIVTYDEHGGFFDHVPPLPIVTPPPPGVNYPPFESTGVRVPALVLSPLVKPKAVYTQALDHTSILQFMAERFGDGTAYAVTVEARRQAGIHNVSEVLTEETPRTDIPKPPLLPIRAELAFAAVKPVDPTVPPRPSELTFEGAVGELLRQRGVRVFDRYPELAHWEATRQNR